MSEKGLENNNILTAEKEEQDASPAPRKGMHYSGIAGDIEKRLCYIGLLAIRKLRFLKRRTIPVIILLFKLLGAVKRRLIYFVKLFFVKNGVSFEFVEDMLVGLKRGSAAARKKGIPQLIAYWVMVTAMLIAKAIVKLFSSVNYLAPLAAAAAFGYIIYSTLNLTFALKVTYNGEEIGYIADEAVYERAEKQMLGRIVFDDYQKPDNLTPEFTVASVDKNELLDEDSLTNELIKSSGTELSQATGLYIDDEFMGAVLERRQLLDLLDNLKNKYRTEAAGAEEPTERVDFVKNVEPRDGLYPKKSVVNIDEMSEKLTEEKEAERIYIAVAGDAPILIAQKNGIPYAQLKALNPGIEKKLLIGQEVLVKKSVPTLEVKIVRTETEEEDVSFKIEQIQDTSRYQGYVNVTQRGKYGVALVTSEVTYIDGVEVSRTVLDRRVIKEPVNEKVVVGGKTPLKQLPGNTMNTSSNFIWPTAAGYVSCGFYGYWGHTGMDIANYTGTAIYASAAGIVTKVAYNTTGYGYHIIINHGGGVSTLYGHNSKLHVKVGEMVKQGQLIASMGSTGRSSGPHCHFEIRINGKYMNPANYIGTRCPY
ncbi:MAG: peptidoglycan DD-metalloendopeptidase family protein [Oscillospiraceae bacterium]|nr:peptidoglycan DD-metalloendopeptidase family protein [Oscillospiraceae bacterium]